MADSCAVSSVRTAFHPCPRRPAQLTPRADSGPPAPPPLYFGWHPLRRASQARRCAGEAQPLAHSLGHRRGFIPEGPDWAGVSSSPQRPQLLCLGASARVHKPQPPPPPGAEDTATELPFPPVENASQGQSTPWRRTIFRYPTYPTARNFAQLGAVAHEVWRR